MKTINGRNSLGVFLFFIFCILLIIFLPRYVNKNTEDDKPNENHIMMHGKVYYVNEIYDYSIIETEDATKWTVRSCNIPKGINVIATIDTKGTNAIMDDELIKIEEEVIENE